jgi:hypothetical protein
MYQTKMSIPTIGTTLQIHNNLIIINLPKINEDIFSDADKQTLVILKSHLAGFNINYDSRSITLFLTISALESFNIDFDRGGIDSRIAQRNFDAAVALLAV